MYIGLIRCNQWLARRFLFFSLPKVWSRLEFMLLSIDRSIVRDWSSLHVSSHVRQVENIRKRNNNVNLVKIIDSFLNWTAHISFHWRCWKRTQSWLKSNWKWWSVKIRKWPSPKWFLDEDGICCSSEYYASFNIYLF